MEVKRTQVIVALAILFCLEEFADGTLLSSRQRRSKLLSRKRRYLTFPEGSSFSMAACMTVGVLGQPFPGLYTFGMNWGIAFELPNQTESIRALKRFKYLPRPVLQRRYRRDLYEKLELAMNSMGYNGRECIFRALCESAKRLLPGSNSIIEELLRVAFTLPTSPILSTEPLENHLYDTAHRSGRADIDCSQFYKSCPFSLVDLALGRYNAPTSRTLSPDVFGSNAIEKGR